MERPLYYLLLVPLSIPAVMAAWWLLEAFLDLTRYLAREITLIVFRE